MNTKRKILGLISLLLILVLLEGCSQNSNSKQISIGIIQYTQHPALNAAKEGFIEGLSNENIKIIEQNAQGEINNINSITSKFLKDEVDLIFAISTPVAQTVKSMNSKIPVVFTAVTDPIVSNIVDSWESSGNNFTGTSDAAPIKEQLKIFKDINPRIKNIGIIYSTSEINSQIQVKEIENLSKDLGLEIKSLGISDLNELPKAVDSLIPKVDGIYTPADNMVASGINIISEKAIEANIPTIGAESAHVDKGILATKGINYFDLGLESASMAKKILLENVEAKDLPISKSKEIELKLNNDTLDKLNLDPAIFK